MSVKAVEASAAGISIYKHDSKCKVAKAYAKVTDELVACECIRNIEISKIQRNENAPNEIKQNDALQALIESIDREGVRIPVVVRETGKEKYEILSGNRRMIAAKLAGLKIIPAVIKEMTDSEAKKYIYNSNQGEI